MEQDTLVQLVASLNAYYVLCRLKKRGVQQLRRPGWRQRLLRGTLLWLK